MFYFQVWKTHPLYPKEYYTDPLIHLNLSSGWSLDPQDVNSSIFSSFYTSNCNKYPQHCDPSDYTTTANTVVEDENVIENEPNTALLSTILMFGTFMIAYGLKQFRNSHYFGRTVNQI